MTKQDTLNEIVELSTAQGVEVTVSMDDSADTLDEALVAITASTPPPPPVPPVAAKLPGRVAPGRAIVTKRMHLKAGDPVGPGHFNNGQVDFENHITIGSIELVD